MNGGSAEVGSEVLVMCGSFGLSVMTMRVGQRTYEIAQDIEGVGAQERQITTLNDTPHSESAGHQMNRMS